MRGKNGLYNAWQELASQQVCYNAPMIRDMIMKPLCVYTFSFGRSVFHRITPRIKYFTWTLKWIETSKLTAQTGLQATPHDVQGVQEGEGVPIAIFLQRKYKHY
jgi:hypothetical protein